jgi:FMN phosphatase YigB (HAD superfamily)
VSGRGLVIFDAFNTLVTAHPGSRKTFLAGLAQAGLDATASILAALQLASQGLDHLPEEAQGRWLRHRRVL